MANTAYITAGLPVEKDGESPVSNTAYITAGLPPEVLSASWSIGGVEDPAAVGGVDDPAAVGGVDSE